jgi:hypothetical protein
MSATLSEPLPQKSQHAADISFHVVLLGLATAIVGLSFILTVAGETQVLIPFIEVPLPGVCTYQRLFGIGCPGCGLTRSFISFAHGDIQASFRFNPAGPLGFLFVAAQIPYRCWQLRCIRRRQKELSWSWLGQTLFGGFFVVLMTQWLIRTFFAA